jgi:hypothetical protein
LQTALDRDVDDNVSVIVLEMPGSKRSRYIPRAFWFGLAGIAVVVVVALIITFLLIGNGEEQPVNLETSPSVTTISLEVPATVSIPTPATGLASIRSGGAGATVINAEGEESLDGASRIEISPGVSVRTGSEAISLLFSDGTSIILAPDTEVELVSVAGSNDSGSTDIYLKYGTLIVQSASTQINEIRILNPGTAEVVISTGRNNTVVGVFYNKGNGDLEVDCLLVGPCDLIKNDNTGFILRAGERGVVTINGQSDGTGSARFDLYFWLSEIVPTPTLTPTPTFTPTPTPTFTPTPRPTNTPTPTDTPIPIPTVTPTETMPPPPNPPGPGPSPSSTAKPESCDLVGC